MYNCPGIIQQTDGDFACLPVLFSFISSRATLHLNILIFYIEIRYLRFSIRPFPKVQNLVKHILKPKLPKRFCFCTGANR